MADKLKQLWETRQALISRLQNQRFVIEGREPTAEERSAEEKMEAERTQLDAKFTKAIEEVDRQGSFDKYGHLIRPSLNSRDMELDAWARDALMGKRPGYYDLMPDERDTTIGQPGLEYRDTLTTTATQALPVAVYPRFMMHLVEQTPVMRAGATVITTQDNSELKVPKTTGFVTSALVAEGAAITESDPTLAVVTLKTFKYASLWQLSRELVDTSPANLLDTLAKSAATSLALAYGVHLAIGTGSGQPLGYAVGGTVGVTGPTGTGTTFGTQGTADQGTDVPLNLYASIAEPYLLSPAVATLGRNSTFTLFRKYKEGSTNRPLLDMSPKKAGASGDLMGQPFFIDPHTPVPANTAKSLAFGDWSRYAVRIKQGVRLDRSDDFGFDRDLVTFRAIIELDGAIIDANAIKLFQHTT